MHYTSLLGSLPPTPTDTSLHTHIHTEFTRRALASYSPNSLLGTRPPPVADEERQLPRADRVTLARLRCGHHQALPSYMHRIGRADSDSCVRCHADVGDTQHVLLHCPTLDTHRTRHHIHSLEHLWTRPVAVMQFLHDAGVL